MDVKRMELNELVRQIGSGIAFSTEDSVGASIKQAWDELYHFYFRATGLDIKSEADIRGFHSALDYVEQIGCLDRMCTFALHLYKSEYQVLVGKRKAARTFSALAV